jgi:hypothetical protein
MRLGLLLFAVLLLRLEPVAGQDQEATVDDPGIGVSLPKIVESVGPGYTSEAMRAKIQGWNMVEAIVRPDGTVSDVRVVRSLDSTPFRWIQKEFRRTDPPLGQRREVAA